MTDTPIQRARWNDGSGSLIAYEFEVQMYTVGAALGEPPYIGEKFGFVGRLAVLGQCFPLHQKSGYLKTVKGSVAVPVYFGQARVVWAATLQKTVQNVCGVFDTFKNLPILLFQIYVESHTFSVPLLAMNGIGTERI